MLEAVWTNKSPGLLAWRVLHIDLELRCGARLDNTRGRVNDVVVRLAHLHLRQMQKWQAVFWPAKIYRALWESGITNTSEHRSRAAARHRASQPFKFLKVTWPQGKLIQKLSHANLEGAADIVGVAQQDRPRFQLLVSLKIKLDLRGGKLQIVHAGPGSGTVCLKKAQCSGCAR